jgi:hypothetical protein
MQKVFFIIWILLGLVGYPLTGASVTQAPSMPTVMPPNLTPPVLPAHPSQADHGQQVYYLVCMVCHGDQGQGLTREWIAASTGMGPLSCYAAKCHGPAHPPEGFLLPKTIPPVRAPAIRTSFPTALSLYQFIHKTMPYQAPGSLKDEEYWQLTAFLMRINGRDLGSNVLGLANAGSITWTAPQLPFGDGPEWFFAGVTGILLAAGGIGFGGYLLYRARRKRSRPS